tara:strand:- start:74 stop:538 length:465 start_codon:yes stop_codon:yes gene_type:complete
MRLAERHRLNPRKKKKEEKKRDPSVKLRRRGREIEAPVVYISKGIYDAPSPTKQESASDLLNRLNSVFGLKLEDDADKLLTEVFKRGWKVSGLDLVSDRTYGIRFHRSVGDDKSRTFVKKADSLKKLLLLALEHVLNHEENRYKKRMDKLRRGK